MFIMFISVSALRNNSFFEFKLIKEGEKFFAQGSNKEKSFYPLRVCNQENLRIFEDSISKPVDFFHFCRCFSFLHLTIELELYSLYLFIFRHDIFDNSDPRRMRKVLSNMNPAYVLTH